MSVKNSWNGNERDLHHVAHGMNSQYSSTLLINARTVKTTLVNNFELNANISMKTCSQ